MLVYIPKTAHTFSIHSAILRYHRLWPINKQKPTIISVFVQSLHQKNRLSLKSCLCSPSSEHKIL